MVGVDKIGEIRRAYFEQERPIKEIVRTLSASRATVRKIIRGHQTEFKYARDVQPTPKLGVWVEALTEILESESKLAKRERRSTQRLFEELRGRGYDGAHDSVHRFVRSWREERARVPAHAYVPMSFAPGEAYQFDWSHETITLQGLPLTVKAAHMKLSHSRMPFVRVYFRETQELVFDAHDKAFQFYGGICRRGIYDNMKTAVEAIFVGKARRYNGRFLQMCSHHLIEPVACTPASGWEKGQVENQVGNLRDQMFRPKPRVKSLTELNAWLEDQCIAYAKRTRHPEFKDRTIWDVFEEERASLMQLRGPFDGFVEKAVRASTTCLIMADHNRYSVDARAAGRMVLVRSHAERVVVMLGDEVVADHPRQFQRDRIIYDPWHYLPVLMKKPGALRNGAPFKDWDLPAALTQVRAKLKPHTDGDRQFVKILGAVLDHGLGMRASFDEIAGKGLARRDELYPLIDSLIRAERTHRQARSISYRIAGAKFPVLKDIDKFVFADTPVDEGQVRELTSGAFLDAKRNAIFIGGTGTGKTHLCIAVHSRPRQRALLQSGRSRKSAGTREGGRS